MIDNSTVTYQKKLKRLFNGKTTFKNRFLPGFLSAFALSFTLFLYGPMDLTWNGRKYINCTVLELAPYNLLFWFITFAFLAIPTVMLGGKTHSFLVSFYCALALGFYIQGNYLNIDLGILNGISVPWENYLREIIINYLFWFIILQIPFLFHYFSRKFWSSYIILVSFTLIAMQSISLGTKLYDQIMINRKTPDEKYALSLADQYIFSPNKNIVVFILDRTSELEIHKTLELYPNMLDKFHDFTCYDNMNTDYLSTFPALTHMLTMADFHCSNETTEAFFFRAWHSNTAESFYNEMQKKGWKANLYIDTHYGAGIAENMVGKVSNVVETNSRNYTIDKKAFTNLLKLSFYRYLPLGMKAPFLINTGDVESLKVIENDFKIFDSKESAERFWSQGLHTQGEGNLFTLYHYDGAHPPYRLSSEGVQKSGNSRMEDQLAGYFHTIGEIMQYMKDEEIYNDAMIIITSDHGGTPIDVFNPQPIFYIKKPREKHEKMYYSHAMISQENFLPTIADAAELDAGKYGKTIFDIPEELKVERCMFVKDFDIGKAQKNENSNIFRKYCYTGDSDELIRKISIDDYTAFPIVDPF